MKAPMSSGNHAVATSSIKANDMDQHKQLTSIWF
jgi:hypothetical protein